MATKRIARQGKSEPKGAKYVARDTNDGQLTTVNKNAPATASKILAYKRSSLKFLQSAGIATQSGKLSSNYKKK